MNAILANRLFHLSQHTDQAKKYHEVIGVDSGLILQDTKQNDEFELNVPAFLGWRTVLNKLVCFDNLPEWC